jgi:outer membrane protein assembly factor BamE (lipoprotein component of BamABCDE complex)
MSRTAKLQQISFVTIFAFVSICLASCEVKETMNYGYVPDEELLEAVRPGVQTRDQIQRLLGSPSTIGTFESNYWYYINRTTERVALLEAEALEQNVLVVEFGTDDRVAELYRFTLEDGKVIDPVTRQTPTRGQKINVFQQLLNNIGRFNPNREDR